MKKIQKTLVVAATALLTIHGAAFAQSTGNSGWYAGGSFGKSNIKPSIDLAGAPSTLVQDESGHGYKFLVGYQISPNVAVEAQYQNLGKYTLNDPGVEAYKLKIQGLSVAAVGFLPVATDLSLIGKAGIAIQQFKDDYVGYGVASQANIAKSSLLLGVGAEYNLTPALAFRVEYEYFGSPRFEDTKIKTDLLSVGLRYRF